MPIRWAALLLFPSLVFSQSFQFEERRIADLHGERFAGAALTQRTLFAWGDRVLSVKLPAGKTRTLVSRTPAGFRQGGCVLDVRGHGQQDLVLNEATPEGALVWLESPRYRRHVIDTGVQAADIMPATLFGRRGVLLIYRGAQIRFYEIPPDPAQPWPLQELYSFYTPSNQGGLGMADIDGDGFPDILAGNDWIKSPTSFELPWRLFAIELWNEDPPSAMLRVRLADLLGTGSPNLIAAQREMQPARLAWFEKPPDPKQLWIEHRIDAGIGGSLALSHAGSLEIADFDHDGRPDVLVAESAGLGRLLIFGNEGGGRFTPQVIAQGAPIDRALVIEGDRGAGPDVLSIAGGVISLWKDRIR